MKSDSLKLYSELTNKERAAISFRYMADGNETEFDRIISSVPHKTYRGPDFQYGAWLHAFFDVWSTWAIEHWKCRFRAMQARCGAQMCVVIQQNSNVSKLLAALELWESRLLALDAALEGFCKEHGLDIDAVRGLTETEAYRPVCRGLTPDSEYLERTQADLRSLIEAHAQNR